jgi:hypothetical protein
MVFSHWRIIYALEKSHVNLSKVELVGSNLLLIAGGIVFGIGLGSFEFIALGLALSFGGGTMLFCGVVLTIKTFIAIANSLLSATKVI